MQIHPSYHDQMFWIFFICEYFQIFCLVKKQGLLNTRDTQYIYLLGFDLITFFNFEDENYWKFVTILLSFVSCFIILCGLVIVLKRFPRNSKITNFIIDILTNTIQPLFGNFLFMPISLMVLSVYRCEEGLSDDYLQSFFFRDCSQFCYKGKHKNFIIAATTVFTLYLPLAIYLRPYWQANQTEVNIETSSAFYSILSVFQLLLILIKINTEIYSEVITGFFISACLVIMSGIAMFVKCINYKRALIFQLTYFVMAFWSVIVSTSSFIYNYDLFFKVLLVCGIGSIAVLGVGLSSKFPNYFIADYADTVPLLMKYQFLPNFKEKVVHIKYFLSLNSSSIQDSTALNRTTANKLK